VAKGKGINLNLPSVDELFSTQEERDEAKRESVRNIPIAEITDFPNHPFKVKTDENMLDMVESVKEHGVLVPALVREKPEGGYEMVAGHRRKMASELAEKKEMPCIVRNLTDDEAILIMVDSNLQREKILPSEKAFAYKMKLEAMNRQAGRPSKNNLTPVVSDCNGMRTNEVLAKQVGESRETIRRFIRLTELIPSILDLVDDSKIAMRPAVELSYLPKDQQEILLDTMQAEDCTPSHAQAIKLRKFSEEGRLNEDVVLSILAEEKGNQKEQFRMPKERINKYFSPGTPAKQMEDTIIKALEMYRKRERNKDQERER
jgi:ParB-like chromosome segregation protein Spo0J